MNLQMVSLGIDGKKLLNMELNILLERTRILTQEKTS